METSKGILKDLQSYDLKEEIEKFGKKTELIKEYFSMQTHLKEDAQFEFKAVEKFLVGLGYEIGTGTNRLSPTVLGCDNYNHPDADMVWDCLEKPYPFKDERFDFVFSSHVIEDFAPEDIPKVYEEWMRLVKPGGYLVLLVPDMHNKRYPDFDEVFAATDEEVIAGKRQIGELKGNSSHRITMGEPLLRKLMEECKYKGEVIQCDTIDHKEMTLDFVVKKMSNIETIFPLGKLRMAFTIMPTDNDLILKVVGTQVPKDVIVGTVLIVASSNEKCKVVSFNGDEITVDKKVNSVNSDGIIKGEIFIIE